MVQQDVWFLLNIAILNSGGGASIFRRPGITESKYDLAVTVC